MVQFTDMSKNVTRLFEQFRPENYNLDIKIDKSAMSFSGKVVITGKKVGRPSKRLTFHQKDLKITSATITKNDKKGPQDIVVSRVNSHKSYDEVRLHSDNLIYPGNYTIAVEFNGKIRESMHGVYVCNYKVDGKKQTWVATQFESHHAREAFPCIDEPEAKATFDLALTSSSTENALSNMPAIEEAAKGSQKVTTFETSPKMSTYLLAWVIGEMHHKETKTKDDVLVRVWATRAQPAASLDFGLDLAKRVIEFFNDSYGVPYPLAKSDHIALPDFSSAAMENWGLITYREPFLLADPATTSQSGREVISMVVSHELSHQWFGNLVTMKWWDDLWLNESFANVMEYLAVDALFPEWKIWDTFITREGLGAFRRDSIDGVQAVKTAVKHPDEISTLFDPSIVYAKGGRLLYMLMNYIGEKDFRIGLKSYFKKHAYANTTGDDLWAALAEASGKDVAGFMNPWLERSGFPIVTVNQKNKEVAIDQQHFLLDQSKIDKSRIWPVPLLASSADIVPLLNAPGLRAQLSSDEFISINTGAVGHYVVHYKNPNHAKYIAGLATSKMMNPCERLMLLSDSSMMSRAGVYSFARTLELLDSFEDENDESVWDIISLIVGDVRRFIDVNEELETPIKAFLRKLIQPQYERLGWIEARDESSHDTKLRATIIALGVYSEHTEIVKKALDLFKAYKKDSTAVSSDLRSIVFGAAIREEQAGAFDWLLNLDEETNNADLKSEVLGALTLVKSKDIATMLLERVKDPKKVRLHDVDGWLVSLMRNRHTRDTAWKWLRDNWQWLEKTFASDKSYDYLPRYAASAFGTERHLQEYKDFFIPMKNQPALTRNIVMGVEELENRVAWLKRDIKDVEQYFQVPAANE